MSHSVSGLLNLVSSYFQQKLFHGTKAGNIAFEIHELYKWIHSVKEDIAANL
jgi:hypothetical protein